MDELKKRFGLLVKLPNSNSLYEIGQGTCRIYIRYSKVHGKGVTFYGLRKDDLIQLVGHLSFIVFLWDGQQDPLFLPFNSYEHFLKNAEPARDGQFKIQIYVYADSIELYIAKIGRFNLEGLSGWGQLSRQIGKGFEALPDLSHSEVQSIVSAIGHAKGYDIWVPQNNRVQLQPELTHKITYRESLPPQLTEIVDILQEIDVIWLERGSNDLIGLFEVEHTTPIYTALLRFNDVYLISQNHNQVFRIIANEERRPLFVRQLNRPTFRVSGLSQVCSFLEYRNVYGWFQRICSI
jgi:hypothetical protein